MENPTDRLRVKVALDTQILAYLADNTYPNLTFFIKALSENKYVDIVCSRFAIYEFIGIRKLEHYLRSLVKKTEIEGGKVNFSSALKYKREFNSPELKYMDAYEDIKKSVEEELNTIYNDFNIAYENVSIHNELWKPYQDLVLSTRISKEDSLLLISSVFPDSFNREEYLILFTNDSQFHQALTDSEKVISDEVFEQNGLRKPYSFNLREITLQNKEAINLVDYKANLLEERLTEFSRKFIFEHIKDKNRSIIIGETINCACSQELKKELLCFKLQYNQKLVENMYLSILTKEFKLYNHPVKLSDFRCQNTKINLPYKSSEDEKSKEIAIKLVSKDGQLLEESLMKDITAVGNLVFVHPDSNV